LRAAARWPTLARVPPRLVHFVLFCCLTFAGACGRPRLPERVDVAAWRRVTTEHFELRTDFDSAKARSIAQRLESARDALVSAAWPDVPFRSTERLHAIVLADRKQFKAAFGADVAGVFDHMAIPTFIVAGDPEDWDSWVGHLGSPSSILRHEMAHQLSAAVMPHQPQWFAEGLAQFLETVRVSDDGASVVAGGMNMNAFQKYLYTEGVPFRRLLEWGGWTDSHWDGERHGLYGEAWVFVHWLYDTRAVALARYQADLAKGVDPGRAFASAFSDLDRDTIDTEIYRYAHDATFREFAHPFHRTEITFREESMSGAEVHLARARIAFAAADGFKPGGDREGLVADGQRETTLAIDLDDTIVEAALLATWLPRSARLALAGTVTFAHPDDARAFELLGAMSDQPKEKERAYRRALELGPDNAHVMNELAWLLVGQRRAEEAEPLAKKALEHKRDDWNVNDTYAAVRMLLGHCSDAIDYETKAVDLAKNASDTVRKRFAARLSAYRTTCTTRRP
jgi:hypothetical protein